MAELYLNTHKGAGLWHYKRKLGIEAFPELKEIEIGLMNILEKKHGKLLLAYQLNDLIKEHIGWDLNFSYGPVVDNRNYWTGFGYKMASKVGESDIAFMFPLIQKEEKNKWWEWPVILMNGANFIYLLLLIEKMMKIK